jgi:hypothetical protein
LHDADAIANTILVFRPHKYYSDQFHIEMYEAQLANNGKIKAPFNPVDPQYRIWNTESIEEAKFYIAISKFQATAGARNAATNIEVLKAIAKNPLQLEVFYHKEAATHQHFSEVPCTCFVADHSDGSQTDRRAKGAIF